MTKKVKAVGLLSGGLDSLLAVKILKEINVLIYGLHVQTPFGSKFDDTSDLEKFCGEHQIELDKIETSFNYIEILKDPIFGYGRNLNPCIDCHIYMLKKAKELMTEKNADFVFTGEVLNERPMSQRSDTLNLIENKSGLKGYLLRPLSAKHLEPTVAEKKGLIPREKLYDIIGRSRKKQFELADKFNIKKFPTPAGGCLLTDSQFTQKLKTIFELKLEKKIDLSLLKYGRLFILSERSVLILGRNESENYKILELADPNDIKLTIKDIKSSYGIIVNSGKENELQTAASVCARYSKVKTYQKDVEVYYWKDSDKRKTIKVKPFSTEKAHKYLVP